MASLFNSHVTKKGASTATATVASSSASASAAKASTAMKISFASASASMIGGGSAGMDLLATSPTLSSTSCTSQPSAQQQQHQDNYRRRSSSFSGGSGAGTMTTTVMLQPPSRHLKLNIGRSSTQAPCASRPNSCLSNARDQRDVSQAQGPVTHQKKKQNEALHEFAQKHPTLTARAMVLSTPFNHAASSSVAALVADAACYASVLCAARPMEVSQLFQRQLSSSSNSKQYQMRTFLGSKQQNQDSMRSFETILKSLPTKQQAPILAFYEPKRIEFSELYRKRMDLLSRITTDDGVLRGNQRSSTEYDARGLRNPSQMCFVNSVLQAMTSLPSMVSYLQSSVWMMASSEIQSVQSQVVQQSNEDKTSPDKSELSDVLLELLLDLGGVGFHHSLQSNNYSKLEADSKSLTGPPAFSEAQSSHKARMDRVKIASSPLNRPVNHDILHTIAQRHTQFRNSHTQAATVGLEQHDAQEFFQALMDYLINEVQRSHLMDVDAAIRKPSASFVHQDEDEPTKETVALPSLLQRMQIDAVEACENADKNLKYDDTIETSISAGDREPETMEVDFKTEDAFLDAQATNFPTLMSEQLMCDNYSDSAAEEKKSSDDYGYKYSIGKSHSSMPHHGKHVSFQDAGGLPMTHVTTSTSTDTTSNSTEATSTFDLQSDDTLSIGLSSFQETLLSGDDSSCTDSTSTTPFDDETKMLSVLQSTAPSPLSGWLGSCLQCCSCHSFRPILNAPFVDIPVVPTAVTNLMAGRTGGTLFPRTSDGTSAGSPTSMFPGCSVKQCLADFTSIERVTDVECRNCALIEAKRKVADERALLQRGIQSMRSKALDSSALQGELELYIKRQKELDQMDLDDDTFWESTDAETDNLDEFVLSCSDPSADSTKLKPLKRNFWKCLLITRLPSVICLHIQRRYFDVAQDRMVKALQHVSFEETLDMAPFCVYAGEKLGRKGGTASSNKCGIREGDQTNSAPYRLMSVVEHRGNAHMGHYVTYRRVMRKTGTAGGLQSNKWVQISDETVNVVNWQDVQRAQAYMLFYEAM